MRTAAQPTASFETALLSRRGGRPANEDACDYAEVEDAACWVVADGLGGHRGGKIASGTVVEAVLASFRSNPNFSADALESHVDTAQRELLRLQREDPDLPRMRSTVVVLLTDFRRVIWAHVGDSRLYGFDECGLRYRTKDHSIPQALVNVGRLLEHEVRGHPDRNRLLLSLGEAGDCRPTIERDPKTVYRGTALLLCTDGFWEHVTETEMLADLAKSLKPGDWLAYMEARLIERVSEGHDNYTAVAIFLSSSLAPPSRAVHSRFTKRGAQAVVLCVLILICVAALAAIRLPPLQALARAVSAKIAFGQTAKSPEHRPPSDGADDGQLR